MPGLRLSVQWFHRGYQAVLRVDAEEPLNVCVLRDHVPRRTGNVNRPLCSEELNRVCFFSPAGMLPDRVDGDVCVLGVDSSHNGARRLVLLYLKCVAGSYEHRRLVCILHRNLHTQEHCHFLKRNCYIYHVTHTRTNTVCLLMLPGTNIEASNSRIQRVSFVLLCIVWCAYLYCGFILIGPPSKELGVNVGVWSLHLQRVQAFVLIVHRLKERQTDREREMADRSQ